MHIRRLALTIVLAVATLTATLTTGGTSMSSVAHAANCLTCGNGDGGGGSGGTPTPPNGPSALVVMGDSFASGEGGLWNGNPDPIWQAPDSAAARYVTSAGDANPIGAYGQTWYDKSVWPNSQAGCHRSDVAEAQQPGIASVGFNIACSGAQTINVIGSSWGGQSFKGEAPQADQLLGIALSNRVTTIVLSIGGNDLKFADIITACAKAEMFGLPACNGSQQTNVMQAMPTAMANVTTAIHSIQAAMNADGYKVTDYRLVLQGYPSPLPPSSSLISASFNKRDTMGCPFYAADADWAHNTFIPELTANLEQVAHASNVQFLDLSTLFNGHELCSTSTYRPLWPYQQNGAQNEWVREITFPVPATPAQAGFHSESVHPDAYGQQAVGQCLYQLSQTPILANQQDYRCTGAAGQGPGQVRLGLSLQRYYNPTTTTHWVTSGAPTAGYNLEFSLGMLTATAQPNTQQLFECVAGSWNPNDHYLSFDSGCEGGGILLGSAGFIATTPPANVPSAPIYRCWSGHDHFVSIDSHCEGTQTDTLLGYVSLP